jgi:hypothetical protein
MHEDSFGSLRYATRPSNSNPFQTLALRSCTCEDCYISSPTHVSRKGPDVIDPPIHFHLQFTPLRNLHIRDYDLAGAGDIRTVPLDDSISMIVAPDVPTDCELVFATALVKSTVPKFANGTRLPSELKSSMIHSAFCPPSRALELSDLDTVLPVVKSVIVALPAV